MTQNAAQAKIFYGMHFYPGVAEYQEPNKEPYRVFLNEDTIRSMDPTFAGRPVFVMHVDGVDDDIDVLKKEADGWVVESFYNQADGKHWVKIVITSEKAEDAIKKKWCLSNCYIPKTFNKGGLWNGVSYAKQVLTGEYEHLAIVPNPRYEESVIMTPDEFKKYNEDHMVELKRLANDDNKGKDRGMKLKFFKKATVENAIDESMSVVLPKSGREVTILQLVNEADRVTNEDPPPPPPMPPLDPKGVASLAKAFGNEGLADPAHKVKLHDGSYCNVAELVDKHKAMSEEMEKMKSKKEDSEDQDKEYEDKEKETEDLGKNAEGKDMPHGDAESDVAGGEAKKNKEDEDKKALMLKEHEEKEVKEAKAKNAKEKAEKLRNAHLQVDEVAHIDLSADKVARGIKRYGSN